VLLPPLIGHKIHSQTVRSRTEFRRTLRFLGSIGEFRDEEENQPLVLHISAHGIRRGKGICFGADDAKWSGLAEMIQPFVKIGKSYKGDRIVVLSACNAHKQTMTSDLKRDASAKTKGAPPKYLFCTEKDVYWEEAAVGWTLFYHLMPKANLDNPSSIRDMLKKIALLDINIHYFRWDEQSRDYKHYDGKSRR
jgi:hypothetical protein